MESTSSKNTHKRLANPEDDQMMSSTTTEKSEIRQIKKAKRRVKEDQPLVDEDGNEISFEEDLFVRVLYIIVFMKKILLLQELLEKRTGWAYSTVKTMMDRMATKGLLETERIRKMILFRPAIKRVQAQRAELMRTVKRAFNGAFSPMVEFLLDDNNFSKEELEHLKALLQQKSNRKGTRKPKK